MARQVALRRQPFTAPCVLLSGGETTVTVRVSASGDSIVTGPTRTNINDFRAILIGAGTEKGR